MNKLNRPLKWVLTVVWSVAMFGVIPDPAGASPQTARKPDEEIKDLVVMITCQTREQQTEGTGAGIIFGADNERLYIATAEHVAFRCEQSGKELHIEFKWQEKKVKANLLKHAGRPLDLAVLSVPKLKELGKQVNSLPFDRLGSSDALKRGDAVYSLGNHRRAWTVNVTPDRISQREGDLIYFESNFIGEGHSGGALLNDRWELVGMLISDQPPVGEAISIGRILAMLGEWNYPMGLSHRFNAANLRTLSTGYGHNCVLTNGAAYCWGFNEYGELGIGSRTRSDSPVLVQGNLSFVSISAGTSFTCGLTGNGFAYCWGFNVLGALGNGSQTSSEIPVRVVGGLMFTSVSAGSNHACGLTAAGVVYCWGGNEAGQLGNGSKISSNLPVQVTGGLNFKSVAAGVLFSCGITTGNRVYCWGRNGKGQLGNESNLDSTKPVPVHSTLTFDSVTVGLQHACAMTADGRASCWGSNDEGELGNGSDADSNVPVAVSDGLAFKSVSAGGENTCGLTGAGAVYCWGKYHDFVPTMLDVRTYRDSPDRVIFSSISSGDGGLCATTISGYVYCWRAEIVEGTTQGLVPVPRSPQP